MAGYRAPGDRFINATTTNNQMDDQRAKYLEKNQESAPDRLDLGIARSTTPLFRMPTNIFEESTNVFRALDIGAGEAGELGNPDFIPITAQSSLGSFFIYNDVHNQSDKPNRKGPNLIAPDINDATFSNDEQQGSRFENRGFGWRDQRNEPATETARIGEYFSKHYSVTGPSDDPAVFGEAKSPDSDPNIDYDQP